MSRGPDCGGSPTPTFAGQSALSGQQSRRWVVLQGAVREQVGFTPVREVILAIHYAASLRRGSAAPRSPHNGVEFARCWGATPLVAGFSEPTDKLVPVVHQPPRVGGADAERVPPAQLHEPAAVGDVETDHLSAPPRLPAEPPGRAELAGEAHTAAHPGQRPCVPAVHPEPVSPPVSPRGSATQRGVGVRAGPPSVVGITSNYFCYGGVCAGDTTVSARS
ncbi:MAG TPA: hypothetical protein VE196_10675 [Pseudonocardiaceae bacterium]|nr:hypothetical protein [Pseudonocardiaceae bacterium]